MKIHFAVVGIGLALAGCAGKKTTLAAAQAATSPRPESAERARPPADPTATPAASSPDESAGAAEGPRPGCTPIGGEPPTCQ